MSGSAKLISPIPEAPNFIAVSAPTDPHPTIRIFLSDKAGSAPLRGKKVFLSKTRTVKGVARQRPRVLCSTGKNFFESETNFTPNQAVPDGVSPLKITQNVFWRIPFTTSRNCDEATSLMPAIAAEHQ